MQCSKNTPANARALDGVLAQLMDRGGWNSEVATTWWEQRRSEPTAAPTSFAAGSATVSPTETMATLALPRSAKL